MQSVPHGHMVVVGLGVSGWAIARHLTRQALPFVIADTRRSPPGLEAFQAAFPGVEVHCGSLDALDLSRASEIVVSPGVDPRSPGLARYWQATCAGEPGIPRVIGEIALFVRACEAPIAAITGSNAKSTVTTLLGEMARESGKRVAVGGNLGTAALDLLAECPDAELYVLELSSFQLETTPCLGATTAAFLNLCEDHLDRHGDMAGYRDAKLAIFHGAGHAVVNAQDRLTWPDDRDLSVARFTTQAPGPGEWGIAEHGGEAARGPWLMHGATPLMAVREMCLVGRHNQANALAALAMGEHLGLAREAMLRVLARFTGLAHRGELVGEASGIRWINDSKGTNVGATLAAIDGLGPTLDGRLIWLGGGLGKGADFTPLAAPLARYAREAVVFGADGPRLAEVLAGHVTVTRCDDLQAAMARASAIAEPGDCVLLSPACASLDQFSNYQARGEAFRAGAAAWLQAFDQREAQ